MKRLKRLIGLLIILCLVLGGVCAYLLRSVDQSYTALLSQSVGGLSKLQKLTGETLSAQRAVLNTLMEATPAEREVFMRSAGRALESARLTRREIADGGLIPGAPDRLATIEANARAYELAVAEILQMAAEGRTGEANQLRQEKVRTALNLYLDTIELAVRDVQAESLKLGSVYSTEVRNSSALMLGLAGLPVLLLLLTAVAVIAVLLAMWVVLRRAGYEDGP